LKTQRLRMRLIPWSALVPRNLTVLAFVMDQIDRRAFVA
jgi:hypothetical protein